MESFLNAPIINMIVRSDWVTRLVLLLLAILSFLTWAIIINRWLYLKRVVSLNKRLRAIVEGSKNLRELDTIDDTYTTCPLGILSRSSIAEYKRIVAEAQMHSGVKDWSFYLQNQFTMASDNLNALAAGLSAKLDYGVFLLAIASSVAPFLGLFGTVWGIMGSFYEIGNQGSASLPVVAPGIAEALVTTIVGLAVAIPASFFYNIFMHRAQRIEDEMDEFGDQLLFKLKQELFDLLYGEKTAKPKQYAQ